MIVKRLFIFLFLTLWLSACSFSLAADITPPPGYQPAPAVESTAVVTSGALFPLIPPSPAEGQAIYVEKCAPCHGETGMGDGPRAGQLPNPVPPLGAAGTARQAIPSAWFSVVTQGNLERFMPPFQSLSDRQRWDVVAYAFSLSLSAESLDKGAAIYAENCLACHGKTGKGDGPQAAGMLVDFTNQAFMSSKSLADFYAAILQGQGQGMPAFGDTLSETDRWAVAGYLRSLTFAAAPAAVEATSVPASGVPQTTSPDSALTPAASLAETVEVTDPQPLSTVAGLIVNLTGGEVPEGLPVMLHVFDQVQQVLTATTTTEAGGVFTFGEVELANGQTYLATVKYQNVTYGSEMVQAAGQTELDLQIDIYESTSEPDNLSVDRLHYFIEDMGEGRIRVVELYIISNLGDKTVAAPATGQPVLTFSIPPEATNLQFEDDELGGRYLQTPDGFGDQMPIRPGQGEYQVLFSYELPYSGKLELKRPVKIPTAAVVILIPEDGIKLKGETIQDAGVRDVQGIQYHLYNGVALSAGQDLVMTISGQAGSRGVSLASSSTNNLLLGLGALGLVLIVAGAWLYRRNQPTETIEEEALENEAETALDTPETVMDAILALDDLYKEGQLTETAYQERRASLKEKLRQAMEGKS